MGPILLLSNKSTNLASGFLGMTRNGITPDNHTI
jgi:hypothetical protein